MAHRPRVNGDLLLLSSKATADLHHHSNITTMRRLPRTTPINLPLSKATNLHLHSSSGDHLPLNNTNSNTALPLQTNMAPLHQPNTSPLPPQP